MTRKTVLEEDILTILKKKRIIILKKQTFISKPKKKITLSARIQDVYFNISVYTLKPGIVSNTHDKEPCCTYTFHKYIRKLVNRNEAEIFDILEGLAM